ncbi:cytoplasmic glycerophosphodiester phosphodiesterase [compost metagenome]
MNFRLVLSILAAFFLFSCQKKEDRFPATKIGGHACAGLEISSSNYHDNTLEAYKYALSFENVPMIEVDVQLSKDGTLWLFHDLKLDEESIGTGAVAQRDDAYLSGLHYRTLEKEQLIRLQDLPADLRGTYLIVDLKESDGTGVTLIDSARLLQAMQQANAYFNNGKLGFITNSGRFVPTMKSLGYTVYCDAVDAAQFLNNANALISDGASFRNSAITISDVNAVKSLGKEVILYDVRSPKGIKSAFNKFPDYLLTDDIKATLIEKYK